MANESYIPDIIQDEFNIDSKSKSIVALLMGGVGCGFERLEIDGAGVFELDPPEDAKQALISVEAHSSQTNNNVVIRFREDGEDPTDTEGIAIGNYGGYEIRNPENIANFKCIRTEAHTHVLQIMYYK